MLNSAMHVRGVLTPANPEAVKRHTKFRIRTEFKEHGLQWVMRSTLGDDGIIEMDSFLDTYEVRHSAMSFIHRLRGLIQVEDIVELKLEGNLMITGYKWETNEPVLLQVRIRNGSLSHQEGHVQWEEEEKVIR